MLFFLLSATAQRGVPLVVRAACSARCSGTKACVYDPTVYEDCCSAEPRPLRVLRLHTQDSMPRAAHMMSGAQQGRLLYMLARLQRAQRVLEIGSFTGVVAGRRRFFARRAAWFRISRHTTCMQGIQRYGWPPRCKMAALWSHSNVTPQQPKWLGRICRHRLVV